ncbi:MAG TPA: hypothetical protein VKU00_04550 [Chthonomonadaceae bacterium]|nr:hypothetical protein [Chthonomonadaceae bacterium]
MNTIHPGPRPHKRPARSPFRYRSSRYTLIRILGAGIGVGLLASGLTAARAQQSALNTPALNGSATLSQFDPDTNTQCDYILGRNLKGPYPLTWKGIRPGSEEVVCDGLLLKRDTDYTIDVKAGSITFSGPIGPQKIVRVSYRCDTVDSAHNSANFALPLQFDLWQAGQSRFSFRTLYHPDPNASSTQQDTPLLSSLQFVGSSRILTHSQLNSGVFIDLRGGDWLGRSGIRLAEKTHLAIGDFGLNYSRAGAQFAQQDTGLTAGREIREATALLKPLTGLQVGGTLRQTTELPDTTKTPDAKGTTTQEMGGTLALTLPKNNGKIDASLTQTNISTPDNPGVQKTQDAVTVQRTLAPGTQATVGFEALTTTPTSATGQENKDQSTYTQTTRVEVKSHPIPQIALTGTFRNDLAETGPSDTEGLKLDLTPFANLKKSNLKQLKLSASWQDQYQPEGFKRNREALVELPTLLPAKAQISGGFRQTSAPGKELNVGLVDAKAHPLRYLEIAGGVRFRDDAADSATPDPDAVNSYTISLALAPWKQLKLTGGYNLNPEASDGTVRKTEAHTVGMESTLGIISVTGQYGFEDQYLTLRQSRSLTLGTDLRLTRRDTLTTGYEGHSLLGSDPSDTIIYKLGYTHHLGSIVDFSVNGTMTQNSPKSGADPTKPELKAEAKVGLHF